MTHHEQVDTIVIGSGPAGLTAAACLAAAGQHVLVLERHDLAGGNATVFRRHHRGDTYEFDVGVHYLGECAPGGLYPSIFGSLGVGDRITFLPFDQDGFDTLIFPDCEVRVPADWDRYRDRIAAVCPADGAGLSRCLDILQTVARQSRERLIPGASTPEFDEWAFRPLSELFAECDLSQKAQALLDHWSGLYAGPPSQTATVMHATMIDHFMRGAFYPEGGGQVIPARLMQVIEAHGGEVRTLTTVARILIENGCAVGVELADGTHIRAHQIIAAGDHTRTVRQLVGETHWNQSTIDWTNQARMTLGLVCAYVVVDIDLTNRSNTSYHVWPSYDIEHIYAQLDRGEMPAETFVYLAFASIKDPSNPNLCPPGHTNFQIMTLAPRGDEFWGVDLSPADGGTYRMLDSYRSRKYDLTEAMLDAAERVLGPFRDHIVHLETATPITHERYTASTGGTSYGYLHSPEQTGHHRPQHRTEIPGLWLTGANTTSGHGIAGAMVGGVNVAGAILERPLLIEMMLGTQLVDPAAIPPDPVPFDLVHYCRGEKLRARRAH